MSEAAAVPSIDIDTPSRDWARWVRVVTIPPLMAVVVVGAVAASIVGIVLMILMLVAFAPPEAGAGGPFFWAMIPAAAFAIGCFWAIIGGAIGWWLLAPGTVGARFPNLRKTGRGLRRMLPGPGRVLTGLAGGSAYAVGFGVTALVYAIVPIVAYLILMAIGVLLDGDMGGPLNLILVPVLSIMAGLCFATVASLLVLLWDGMAALWRGFWIVMPFVYLEVLVFAAAGAFGTAPSGFVSTATIAAFLVIPGIVICAAPVVVVRAFVGSARAIRSWFHRKTDEIARSEPDACEAD